MNPCSQKPCNSEGFPTLALLANEQPACHLFKKRDTRDILPTASPTLFLGGNSDSNVAIVGPQGKESPRDDSDSVHQLREAKRSSTPRRVNSLDVGAHCSQFLHNVFVPAVDVIHALDQRFTVRHEPRQDQPSARPQIGSLHRRS